MDSQVPDEATCAICGRYFDPSETRGWCPNPSCGQWQHPSFPLGDESSNETITQSRSRDEQTADMRACPNCGREVRADANFCNYCATQLESPVSEPEDDSAVGIAECPDCGADLSGIPTDRLSKCPICLYNLEPVIEDADIDDAKEPSRVELTECPNCGEDLSPIPPDLRTVCPGCRTDLDEDIEEDAEGAPLPGTDVGTTGAMPLSDLDFIAEGYLHRLSQVGITTAEDLVNADHNEITPKTGISKRRIQRWIEQVPMEPSHGDTGGKPVEPQQPESNDLDLETRIQPSSDELILTVMGHEIHVTDGETIGREVRNAMVQAGAPEEDAVYVHRKHIRVNRNEKGDFLLTRLGENNLTVNGTVVEKGEQMSIEDGDRIGFSDVVEASVSIK